MAANPRCFFDVSIDGVVEGRLVFELFAKVVPKAVENFRSLCTGEKGGELHYKGSRFTVVRKGFLVEGGGLYGVNGEISIYGGHFEEHTYHLRHSRVGMLSMVPCANNAFASKFCIVTNFYPELDEKYVVFGKLVKGLEILRRIEVVRVDQGYCPLGVVAILESGEIPPGGEDGTINYFQDGDMFPGCPGDAQLENISLMISAVNSIMSIADLHSQKGDYSMAMKKCNKAKTYLEFGWEMSDLTDALSVELSNLKQSIDAFQDASWKAMVQAADEVESVEVLEDKQEVVDLLEEEGNTIAFEDDNSSVGSLDGSPDYDFHFRKGKAYISNLPFQEFDSDTSIESASNSGSSKSGSKSGSGSSMATTDDSSGSGSGSGSDKSVGSGSDGSKGPGLSRFGPDSSGSEDSP